MDIDNTGSPRVPEIIYPSTASDKPVPADRRDHLPQVRSSGNSIVEQELWHVRDKVTISPEARRRYRKMMNLMHRYTGKKAYRDLPYHIPEKQ